MAQQACDNVDVYIRSRDVAPPPGSFGNVDVHAGSFARSTTHDDVSNLRALDIVDVHTRSGDNINVHTGLGGVARPSLRRLRAETPRDRKICTGPDGAPRRATTRLDGAARQADATSRRPSVSFAPAASRHPSVCRPQASSLRDREIRTQLGGVA